MMDFNDIIDIIFDDNIDENNQTYKKNYNKELICEMFIFIKNKIPYKLNLLKSGNYAITLNGNIIDKLYTDDIIEAKYKYIIKIMELK